MPRFGHLPTAQDVWAKSGPMKVEIVPIPHGQPISVQEFDALPIGTSHRYEIENGHLLVSACPAPSHRRAITRLVFQLERQLPTGWEAFAEIEAELPVGRCQRRAPDVVVTQPTSTRRHGSAVIRLRWPAGSHRPTSPRSATVRPEQASTPPPMAFRTTG
ncbi:Uma2 family endonuclease [Nocardia sp. CA-119907]|uniref:Uma2 family endonuclease n=1 Tax=Nocardia sp. CA-119907 TaxID=3239973 RepID=UPI003D95B08B